MAHREEHARPTGPKDARSAGLPPAAERHARELKRQLLESTEQAAEAMIEETRAEGAQRIEAASRQAQGIADTVAAIETAEQVLTERAKDFAIASKALRAELESFASLLSQGESELYVEGVTGTELRLEATAAPEDAEQIRFGDEIEDRDAEGDDVPDRTGEIPESDGVYDNEDGDYDDKPPTPEEIEAFVRETEEAEWRSPRSSRPGGGHLRFSVPSLGAIRAPNHRVTVDVGGALIGLGAASTFLLAIAR